jgi:hypothetical protein
VPLPEVSIISILFNGSPHCGCRLRFRRRRDPIANRHINEPAAWTRNDVAHSRAAVPFHCFPEGTRSRQPRNLLMFGQGPALTRRARDGPPNAGDRGEIGIFRILAPRWGLCLHDRAGRDRVFDVLVARLLVDRFPRKACHHFSAASRGHVMRSLWMGMARKWSVHTQPLPVAAQHTEIAKMPTAQTARECEIASLSK